MKSSGQHECELHGQKCHADRKSLRVHEKCHVSESQEKMDNDNDVWSLQVSNNQEGESSVQDSETSPAVVLWCDVIPMQSEYN